MDLLETCFAGSGPSLAQRSPDGAPPCCWDGAEAAAVSIHRGPTSTRGQVEAFIERAYDNAFGGVLRRHFPTLVCVEDADGRIAAAAGVRLARAEPLFLEQYLDAPIEVEAAQALGAPVARGSVGEIGNLASASPVASARLFLALAETLAAEGCLYAAATATRQLRRKFRRIGFDTRLLAPARAARLAAGAVDWGGYYAREPEVLLGPIAPAFSLLRPLLGAEAAA